MSQLPVSADGGNGGAQPAPTLLDYRAQRTIRAHEHAVSVAMAKREAGERLTARERVLLACEDAGATPEAVATVLEREMRSAPRASTRVQAAMAAAKLRGDIGSRAEETARAAAMGAAAGAAMGTALALPLAESAQGVLGDIREALKAARTRTVAPSPEPKPEPPADAAPPA